MKSSRAFTIISILLLVGIVTLATIEHVPVHNVAHAASTLPQCNVDTTAGCGQVKTFTVTVSGSTYTFTRVSWGSSSTNSDGTQVTVDTGAIQMSLNGQSLGQESLHEVIGTAPTGKFMYTITLTSTIAGLPSAGPSTVYEYPPQNYTGYSSLDESPYGDTAIDWGTQRSSAGTRYQIVVPDSKTHPYTNTDTPLTLYGDGSAGSLATAKMKSYAIDPMKTAYEKLKSYNTLAQAPTGMQPLSFTSAAKPKAQIPQWLINVGVAGGVMWLVGWFITYLCDGNYCGKKSNLIAAIGGMVASLGSLITITSGVNLLRLYQANLQEQQRLANAAAQELNAFERGAEIGYRMAEEGIAWDAVLQYVPADIMEIPLPDIVIQEIVE